MKLDKNEFGVVQYPQDDVRRLFVLLAAIDLLERPTLSTIADLTSLNPELIDDDLALLREQFGLAILKIGNVYRIESWGDLLNRDGVARRLKEA